MYCYALVSHFPNMMYRIMDIDIVAVLCTLHKMVERGHIMREEVK
jgi:TATA-box binding protein (TBP) (component of TFIID and TFIIIB)